MNDQTNGSGMNGSGNGHDPDDKTPEDKKILKFPSLAERDRMRRAEEKERKAKKQAREKQEKVWREQYRAQTISPASEQDIPFFNFGRIPPFTKYSVLLLLLINIPLFLWPQSDIMPWTILHFGFIPGLFTGQMTGMPLWSYLSPLTHMLIHGGWMHLGFNAVMGLALGTFYERQYGTKNMILFTIVCGLAGALLTLILNPYSVAPIIGASGAISGLFGAVILLMYKMGAMGAMGKKGPWPIIGFWLVLMIAMGLLSDGDLAWQAHIGGYVTGAALAHFRPKFLYKL